MCVPEVHRERKIKTWLHHAGPVFKTHVELFNKRSDCLQISYCRSSFHCNYATLRCLKVANQLWKHSSVRALLFCRDAVFERVSCIVSCGKHYGVMCVSDSQGSLLKAYPNLNARSDVCNDLVKSYDTFQKPEWTGAENWQLCVHTHTYMDCCCTVSKPFSGHSQNLWTEFCALQLAAHQGLKRRRSHVAG